MSEPLVLEILVLNNNNTCVKVLFIMSLHVISPVNVEHRKKLDIRPGDTIRVWQKIEEEKGKSRLQAFEGLVLARKHGREAGGTFTVRKVIDGVGVERIFPLYSPVIDEIEMVRRSKVRRAKLYFIRRKAAKEIRHQMRRIMNAKYEEETVAAPVAETPTEEVKVEASN